MFTLSSPLPLIRIYSGCPITVELVTAVELPDEISLGSLSVRRTVCQFLLINTITTAVEGGEVLYVTKHDNNVQ
jgi:hypothetical protein